MDTVEKLDCISYIGLFCTLDTPLQCFGERPGEGLDPFFNRLRRLAPNRQHCDSERGLTRGEKALSAVDLGLLMGRPYKPSVPLRRKKEKPAPRAHAQQAFKKGRALRSPLGVLGVLGGKIPLCPLCLCGETKKNPPHAPVPGKHSKKGEPFARPSVCSVSSVVKSLCALCASAAKKRKTRPTRPCPASIQKRASPSLAPRCARCPRW